MKRTPNAVLLPLILVLLPAMPAARAEVDCLTTVKHADDVQENEILDALRGFADGEVPNLADPNQAALFEVYRYRFFGDPTTQLNPNTRSEIVEVFRRHPNLTKVRFRSLLVGAAAPAKISDEMSKLVQQARTGAQTRNGSIYKVTSNGGFWNKIFENVPALPVGGGFFKRISGEVSKRYANSVGQRWTNYLPESLVDELENEAVPGALKAKKLFDHLAEIRANAIKTRGENAPELRSLNQVMVDVVHAAPFLDKDLVALLKADDGYVVADTFSKLLSRRDEIARSVGYADYPDLLARHGLKQPSALSLPNEKFMRQWEAMKAKDVAAWRTVEEADRFTIRQLSPVESVYRSCIGGNECSSRTYGMKALDPNYHYFTMTDGRGRSSGHLTVVVGTGKIGGETRKIAFIDKVQNVAPERIGVFLEGIRRSLAADGYVLASARDLGDANGLSNSAEVRTFFQNYVGLESGSPIEGFRPNSHEFDFENKFSRAESGLDLFAVSAAEGGRYSLNLDDPRPFRSTSPVDVAKIAEASRKLKHGTERDQIIYVKTQAALREVGHQDPEFPALVERWLSEAGRAFAVKKQLLLAAPPNQIIPLAQKHLNAEEKGRFFTSIVSSPFYRDQIGVEEVYRFLNANPGYLKQISSKSFGGFSVKRLIRLQLDEVLAAVIASGHAKTGKVDPSTLANLVNEAAAKGNTRAVKELAKVNDIDVPNREGRNAIMRALRNKHGETAEALLDSGKPFEVNRTDVEMKSAIYYAGKFDQTSAVRRLKRMGASIRKNDLYGELETTVAIEAAIDGKHDVLRALVEGGVTAEELNLRSRKGYTALIEAARKCDAESVAILLRAGASKAILSANDHDAAHFARRNGCPADLIGLLAP